MALKREWAVEYFPTTSTRLKVVKGFQTKKQAQKWVKAERLNEAEDLDIWRVK
jgi:hypothetical protein